MLKSRIPQIVVEIDVIMEEAVHDGAETVEGSAKARVPRASGALHDSIHVEDKNDGSYVYAGDESVFYGHFVEYGTSRQSPQPFLVPALEENRENITDDARRRLRRL